MDDLFYEISEDILDVMGRDLVIDGKPVRAAVQLVSETLPDFEGKGFDYPGLNVEVMTLQLEARSLDRPMPEQELTVDGLLWTVRSADELQGLLVLKLWRRLS